MNCEEIIITIIDEEPIVVPVGTEEYVDSLLSDINNVLATLTTVSEVK